MSEKVTIKVGGMSCEHCVAAVTKAARGIAGVISVTVNLDEGTAEVVYAGDGVIESVRTAIEDQGYDVPRD